MPPRRPDARSSTTLPRRALGRALRDARDKLGQTLEQASETMGQVGRSTLNRLELGEIEKPKPFMIEFIAKYYGVPDDEVEYLKALAAQSNTKSWFQNYRDLLVKGFDTYLGLESSAECVYVFQPLIIPGLLQTAEYATTLAAPFGAGVPGGKRARDAAFYSEDAINQRVSLRMQRAAMLTRQHKPIRAEFVIDESVLYRVVDSPRVMSGVLRHVADLSTRDNISVRVLPFTAGFPTGNDQSPYIILDFPGDRHGNGEPPVVYTETSVGVMFFEENDDLETFRGIHESIRNASHEGSKSRDLLRQAARRYEQ